MSQKPIDQRSPLASRDALWAAIRRLKIFRYDEVRRETGCSRSTTTVYLAGLTAAGYLQLDAESRYVLVRDVGVDVPKVNRDGSDNLQGKGREQIWTVLPILKEFSIRDVALHASTEIVPVSESTVKEYLKYLHKAGYLRASRESRPGNAGQPIRYRFLQSKYTGPKAPMIQRVRQVFDPNTGKVMWSHSTYRLSQH